MPKIVRVEVGRFDYGFQGEFKFFPPCLDGSPCRPSVLVRLTDESGLQGWGQAVPVPTWTYETPESVETTLANYLAPVLLGCDPTDLAEVHYRMHKAIKPGFSIGQPLCKAAVDLACYDLSGKLVGLPVVALLGGSKQTELTLNWTINSMDMAVVEQQLADGRAHGYEHYTIKVGPPQNTTYDLELVRKVKHFAPDSFLWVDANTGYSLETALQMAPRFADLGVQVFESPLPPANLRGYQALKHQNAVPVFMDEGIISPVEVAEFIALDMFHGITLKPARCAGLYHTKQIVELLLKHGKQIQASGLTDPDLSLAAALHLFAWAGITNPCALNGPQFLADSLVPGGWQPQHGKLSVPSAPGLGVDLVEEAAEMLQIVAEL